MSNEEKKQAALLSLEERKMIIRKYQELEKNLAQAVELFNNRYQGLLSQLEDEEMTDIFTDITIQFDLSKGKFLIEFTSNNKVRVRQKGRISKSTAKLIQECLVQLMEELKESPKTESEKGIYETLNDALLKIKEAYIEFCKFQQFL